MIGNPPWLKMTWKEEGILSDKIPFLLLKRCLQMRYQKLEWMY